MAQSIGDVFVFLLWFYLDVVFVSFWVEMFCDGTVETLVLPLFYVLEVVFFVERGVRDESVLVGEAELLV